MKNGNGKRGFTLVEILVVIAIIAVLAAIIIPAGGAARKAALRRRAAVEMNSIKVAILQFYADHKYMPWPTTAASPARVGPDMWATTWEAQRAVIDMLTTNNPLGKNYLQVPEKSRPEDKSSVFLDPWSRRDTAEKDKWTFYAIGMDRNMDGAVLVKNSGVSEWDDKKIMEPVLIFPTGDTETDPKKKLKTFDLP